MHSVFNFGCAWICLVSRGHRFRNIWGILRVSRTGFEICSMLASPIRTRTLGSCRGQNWTVDSLVFSPLPNIGRWMVAMILRGCVFSPQLRPHHRKKQPAQHPPARCAAWAGSIDFFARFVDQPKAVYYMIRIKRPTDLNCSIFLEKHTHLKIANLGVPGYTGDLVGPDPAIPALHVDGDSAVKVPAFNDTENDPAWVSTHRDREAVISRRNWECFPKPSSRK